MTSSVSDPPSRDFPPKVPPDQNLSQTLHLGSQRKNEEVPKYLGTAARMPEFSLTDRVVLISGAARGLGLVQAEALLEAGATVYALDRLPEPSPDFYRVQTRAAEELGTALHYRQIDVRDVEGLNEIVQAIGETHRRIDGLIAAAGIQQETSALDYTAKDANTMFEVNITGVFMTAQAVAKQMILLGNGGSIVLIASMSGTIVNRVSSHRRNRGRCRMTNGSGIAVSCVQHLESWCFTAGEEPCGRVGSIWHPGQHDITRIYRHPDG